MSKIVFLYSQTADPLVSYAKSSYKNNEEVVFIGFDELARYLEPKPWPICIWSNYPSNVIQIFKDSVVVNRLFGFCTPHLKQLLQDIQNELWIHIALEPLIGSATTLIHDTGPRGLSKTLLPLNAQWGIISDYGRNDIHVPRFVYGFGSEEVDTTHLKDPFRKSIWSLFDWKEERHLSKFREEKHKFFVERPKGIPAICHYLGDTTWLSFPKGEQLEIPLDEFQPFVKRSKACFASSIGEILTFVESDNVIRFYAFSPTLASASKTPEFASTVDNWLTNLH